MISIERLQEVALFNKVPHLAGVLTKSPSFDLKYLLGSILMILGTHMSRNHVPQRAFTALLLAYLLLRWLFLAFRLSHFLAFVFSSLFSSFVEGFR